MTDANVQNHDDKTIMDSSILKKFQDEMASAMKETLKDSKVTDLLEKYGLIDGMVKIHSVIDIKKIKSSQNLDMPSELKSDLEAVLTDNLEIMCCNSCRGDVCCPCCVC